MQIAVDFDGTIAEHWFPDIGPAVPGAFHWMRRWQEAGAVLCLWTVRSDGHRKNDVDYGPVLTQAVAFCRGSGVEFAGVNEIPDDGWTTTSPKIFAGIYVDDAAFGCPLIPSKRGGARPMVDWSIVGPAIMKRLTEKKQ